VEPITILFKAVTVACLTAFPVQPATVPGTIDTTYVSNSTVITQTADQIKAAKAAEAKVAAEKAAAEKAAKEKAAKEAAKEKAEKEVKEKAKVETAKTAAKENLKLPLKAGDYSYTSDYGLRCAPVTGAGNFHYGMDLAAPLGTPMYSIADGTVTSVTDGSGSVGGDVQIESTINGKLMTLRYHHMGNSSQYVKVGDKVKAGEHISDVASTGMSTGAHLHLEVFEGKFSDQKHLDPEEYFDEIGLDIVGSAAANYVNKADHVTSCPGASAGPLYAASSPQAGAEQQAETNSAPAAVASPAKNTVTAPTPAATTPAKTTTPAPAATAKPATTPTPAPKATVKVVLPIVETEVAIP
jgi:murein DD-endopeptidase MepM/ murein hydrolase activator NlpD